MVENRCAWAFSDVEHYVDVAFDGIKKKKWFLLFISQQITSESIPSQFGLIFPDRWLLYLWICDMNRTTLTYYNTSHQARFVNRIITTWRKARTHTHTHSTQSQGRWCRCSISSGIRFYCDDFPLSFITRSHCWHLLCVYTMICRPQTISCLTRLSSSRRTYVHSISRTIMQAFPFSLLRAEKEANEYYIVVIMCHKTAVYPSIRVPTSYVVACIQHTICSRDYVNFDCTWN